MLLGCTISDILSRDFKLERSYYLYASVFTLGIYFWLAFVEVSLHPLQMLIKLRMWKGIAPNCLRTVHLILVLGRNKKKAIECRTCGKIEFAFARKLDERRSDSHAETYSSYAIKILDAISQFARLYWLQTDIWLTFHDLHRQRREIGTACGLQWILKSVSMLKAVSSGLKTRKSSVHIVEEGKKIYLIKRCVKRSNKSDECTCDMKLTLLFTRIQEVASNLS